MDLLTVPRRSAPLLVWALTLGVVARGLAAWSAVAPGPTSSGDSSEDWAMTLAVFAWVVGVPALVCGLVGIYRLASNVDRAAFASLEDQAPLRTGYWSTGSLVVPPPAPASDEPAATTPAGAP